MAETSYNLRRAGAVGSKHQKPNQDSQARLACEAVSYEGTRQMLLLESETM